MTGRLLVVGLGPGEARFLTGDAVAALETADAVFGYKPYLDRVPPRAGQELIASDNREEIARAGAALERAAAGASVAIVSGGDPGVFAMAAAVCEAIEAGPPAWRMLPVTIHPGVTAMLALAARVGAPLGHDFCAISLSDNLKPWAVVEKRLDAAARAGFAMAFYNPISRARPWQLGAAFDLLRKALPPHVPVIFGRAIGRIDERVSITTLERADPALADMATLIIVGTTETRIVERPGFEPLLYTPRSLPR